MPEEEGESVACCMGTSSVRNLHQRHHMGVNSILFVAKKVDSGSMRGEVQ